MRLIKKYPNRRLYDTEKSRYITVNDVRKLVVEGGEFKVIDAETQDDLTRNTLIQIIIDNESGEGHLFTTDLLAKFIRLSHTTAENVFSQYLEQSTRFFLEQQQTMRDQVKGSISGQAVRTLAEITQSNLKLWRDVQAGFLKAVIPTPSKPDADPKDPPP